MVRVPKPNTLKRYGLTEEAWLELLKSQGGVCNICKREPPSGRLCTDHEHVRGWKKMPPDERRRYVRGILCWTCNHYYVGRGITVEKAKSVVSYLVSYEEKKQAA